MSSGRNYDSEVFVGRRNLCAWVDPKNTAATALFTYVFPTAVVIKRISASNVPVGSTTDYGYDIFSATTSFANVNCSSNATGTASANTAIASAGTLVIKNATSDATAKTNIIVSYVEAFDNT